MESWDTISSIKMASCGRALVVKATRRRRVKVRRLRPARVPPLNRAALSGRNSGNTRNGNSDLEVASSDLRSMRIERRDLLKRLSDAESRARNAEKAVDDIILAEKPAIYDEGTELWQNTWDQNDVSQTLKFPTNKSVICSSVEISSGNCMPGVHSLGAIEQGRTTQSIWIKGGGYTLVGLVTSESEKHHIRHKAGERWDELSMMKCTCTSHNEDEGEVVTIEVDMIEKRAELYTSSNCSTGTQHLQPVAVWTNLPDKVWVAVAFKRNSGREAALMPCVHRSMRTA